jgi:hypothetical protein
MEREHKAREWGTDYLKGKHLDADWLNPQSRSNVCSDTTSHINPDTENGDFCSDYDGTETGNLSPDVT